METGVYEIRKHGQAMSRIEKEGWAARKTSLHFKFVFRAAHPSFSMGRTPPRHTNQEGSPTMLVWIQTWQNLPDSYAWLLRTPLLETIIHAPTGVPPRPARHNTKIKKISKAKHSPKCSEGTGNKVHKKSYKHNY